MHTRYLILPLLLTVCLASCGDDGDPTGPIVEPVAHLSRPIDGSYSSVSDSITLSAYVLTDEGRVEGAAVSWRSDRDGLLASGRTDEQGYVEKTVPPLTRGTHQISLTATVASIVTIHDTATLHNILPARVQITDAERSADGIALAWTTSGEAGFAHYALRRWVDAEGYDESVLLAVFDDPATTAASDDLPPIVEAAHYAVEVVLEDGLAAESPTATVDQPCGPVFAWYPYDAVIHPTEPYIYISERYNFFATSRLVAVNYLTWETFGSVNYDHQLNFMDLADNGMGLELYVAHADSGLSVLDPLTLAEIERLDTGYAGVYSSASDGLGHVWITADVQPSVRCYDRNGWQLLSSAGYHGLRLRKVPGALELLGVQTSVFPPSMEHIAFAADGSITALSYCPNPYGVSPYCLRIDPTGGYLLTNDWAYEPGPELTVIGQLPAPDDRYYDFAFDDDGATIYAAERETPAAAVIAYPALTRTGSIPLCGYPLKLFRQDQYLIAICRTKDTDGGTIFAVDVARVSPGD